MKISLCFDWVNNYGTVYMIDKFSTYENHDHVINFIIIPIVLISILFAKFSIRKKWNLRSLVDERDEMMLHDVNKLHIVVLWGQIHFDV